ncbi:glycoside hydrolase family 27 protein [Aquimarina sp. U1-2]|uniref:glycoside hydrolase family 27 protein n=1 Tax=Aquimarina sp. U1-2 TaxID=2823141 RepID=UPI001AEC9CD0|nr:glycoside hydrolase family 27 protein [Aquimarina sp. U1-2]MBP2830674.1 glycoside hydrolase family 27 protein [Aquimarina sp. U1-2]
MKIAIYGLWIFNLLLVSLAVQAQKFENLAPTPPMGWNSWNYFKCDFNEELIKKVADAMSSNGMKAVGYEYIVIDDCWQVGRDKNGNIIPDPDKFPSGMKALADYIHSKGLKFGLYSDAGTKTCKGLPGSRGYEFQDARTYASWGVDFLKYDWCHHSTQDAKASYTLMRDALYKAGRPILFSICEWGENDPWLWAPEVGHMWRTGHDIKDCFNCDLNTSSQGVMQILDQQAVLRKYAGPNAWNDPDMLEVGNPGLTIAESRAHFSLWCMLSAPLIAGNDIIDMSPEIKKILIDKEVIAIDQDLLGIQAIKWLDYGDLEIWFKPLQNEEYAVCFLNRNEKEKTLNFDFNQWGKVFDPDKGWKKYTFDATYHIYDVWKKQHLGTSKTPLKATIPGHDVLLIKMSVKK